jgi:hypothetical protein
MKTPRGRFLPFGNAGNATERSFPAGQVPDAPETDPYKNERVLRTKEYNKRKSTRVLLRKSAVSGFEGEEFVSEEHREAINYYNSQLAPLGWLPVTKVSPALEDALEIDDAERIRELVDTVVAAPDDESWPKRKTLVRLLWNNLWNN